MKVIQSRSFEKKVKKFRKQDKRILDNQIQRILDNTAIGQEKKGDLRGVFIHKIKIQNINYLLSYRLIGDTLELIMIGPHENYYRDLKTYLKSR